MSTWINNEQINKKITKIKPTDVKNISRFSCISLFIFKGINNTEKHEKEKNNLQITQINTDFYFLFLPLQ